MRTVLKVALVIEWLEPWRGGAETSTQQFIHHLLERDVELHVYTRSRLSPTPTMTIHTVSAPALSRASKTAAFARRAATRIRRQSYDVVHAITPCLAADIYQPRGGTVVETVNRNLALRRAKTAQRAKRMANRFNLKQRLMLRLERRLLGKADPPFVACVSQYVARQVQEHYGVPGDRVRVVFNGVDADETSAVQRDHDRAEIRKMYGIADADYLILLVAHNFRLKGVARWIDAQARLSSQREFAKLRCLVVGKDNPLRWQRLAERMKVGEGIQFVGPTRRTAAFRHASDVLVHPTYYDPCSRVVLEALGSGLPCVTTRYDGASEVIKHQRHGLVIDSPDDVNDLADAVKTLSDPAVRRRMSEAQSELAERISMKRHTAEMWDLYQEAARTTVNR